jgi:hypothetical protein
MELQQRIALEKEIVGKLVDGFLSQGYKLGVNDGEETTIQNSNDRESLLSALFTTDTDYLLIYQNDKRAGWIFLVYGNDGYDVVNDYTVNLESIIEPILKPFEEEWS